MRLTSHAQIRTQQRGIPVDVVGAICTYGSISYRRGAMSIKIDDEALDLQRKK